MGVFRHPSGSRWERRSSVLLCSKQWSFLTVVSWQPLSPIFRVLPWRWDRYVVPKRREGITTTRCVITKNSAVLILTIYQQYSKSTNSIRTEISTRKGTASRGGVWGWQVRRLPQAPLLRGPRASGLWVCQAIFAGKFEMLIHAPFKILLQGQIP